MGKLASRPQRPLEKRRASLLLARRRKLSQQLDKLDSELEQLQAAADRPDSIRAFDRWLEELVNGPASATSLPSDFSRRDIYDEHD